MEHEHNAAAFLVGYTCDACGKADMECRKLDFVDDKPSFQHVCPSCGTAQSFPEKYPKVIYRAITEPMPWAS